MFKKISLIAAAMWLSTSVASAQELKFGQDGTFKVLQLTDVHYEYGQEPSEYSVKCIEYLLDTEKPDLVVLSGDIVVATPAAPGWDVITELIYSRGIPYATTMGNHDDETDLSRAQISDILEKKPLSLFKGKVKGVTGYGNYSVAIKGSDGKENAAIVYCMDSGSYSQNDRVDSYDWLRRDQVNWYCDESDKYKKGGETLPALAFFHIALPEYKEAFDRKGGLFTTGQRGEDECGPGINTGMFAAMVEQGDVMGISVGHDHVNDYVAHKNGIALCYGQFTGSDNTYGFDEKVNGGRIFVLKEGKRSFDTYIRLADGTVKDKTAFPRPANFVVVADLHFDEMPESDQFCHVNAINKLVPSGMEDAIDGVVIAGDIFDHPCQYSLELFRARYDKRGVGEKKIKYDIYPGYGNHDIDPDGTDANNNMKMRRLTYAFRDSLLGHMMDRGELKNIHPETKDYSWNFGDVHFVQVNRFFGDTIVGNANPQEWENWIKRDLRKNASNGEPVVIVQHYTFTDEWGSNWWGEESRKKMAEILEPYNVIAIFAGHIHNEDRQEFEGIPVFVVNNAWKDESGPASFVYVSVGDEQMRLTTYEWEEDGNDVRQKGEDVIVEITRNKKK